MRRFLIVSLVVVAMVLPATAFAWFDGPTSNATANSTNNNTNTNSNTNNNTNIQGQQQGQIQGQAQGQHQSMGDQKNKQSMSLVIEDTRQHAVISGPMQGPTLTSTDVHQGFHNLVWVGIRGITMKEAKGLSPDVGFLWGTKLTVKVVGDSGKATKKIQRHCREKAKPIRVITFRGNYGTKGYECQGYVLKLAMKAGGRYFVVLKKGAELASKSWSVGMGSNAQAGALMGSSEAINGGGSLGSGTNYGSSKIKARPFITILVLR